MRHNQFFLRSLRQFKKFQGKLSAQQTFSVSWHCLFPIVAEQKLRQNFPSFIRLRGSQLSIPTGTRHDANPGRLGNERHTETSEINFKMKPKDCKPNKLSKIIHTYIQIYIYIYIYINIYIYII